MNGLDDQELLRQYLREGSQAAFASLVRRHIYFVYSVSLRMVVDSHLAEDVTQAVFLAFAESAPKLEHCSVLSGWLHRTARNLAATTVRKEVRRRAREQEAVIMNEGPSENTAAWEELTPHLDNVLDQLNTADREAVLLRYFERKTAREIGDRLGLSEDAAQKRLVRALDQMRYLFEKRGVTVTGSVLAGTLSSQAVQAAPAALVASVTAASLTTFTSTSTSTILNFMASAKIKFSVVSVVAVGLTTAVLVQNQTNRQLRAELSARDARVGPPEVAEVATNVVSNAELAALRADRAELLRLRGEIARLRRQEREGATAAKLPANSPIRGDATRREFVPSENWQDVGVDTPEHAFQSFLATLKAADTNQIESAVYWDLNWKEDVTDEDRRLVEKSKQDYLEMLLRASKKLAAFNLAPIANGVSERTRVFFHTLTAEGADVPSSFEMIQDNGQWKPVLTIGWRYPKEPSSFFTSPVFGPAIDLEH